MHPTSKKVSIQLTKIAGSSSLCTQMLILFFPVGSRIEKEKLSQNFVKLKKDIKISKQFDYSIYLIHMLSTPAK